MIWVFRWIKAQDWLIQFCDITENLSGILFSAAMVLFELKFQNKKVR